MGPGSGENRRGDGVKTVSITLFNTFFNRLFNTAFNKLFNTGFNQLGNNWVKTPFNGLCNGGNNPFNRL